MDKIEAFGECKGVNSWFLDPRCNVSLAVLKRRLSDKKKWTAEDAIRIPSRATLREAFGESKTIAEWLKDPRCTQSAGTVYTRLKKGDSLEDALTQERRPAGPPAGPLLRAFGEEKTLKAWSRDPRFGLNEHTLRSRLDVQVLPLEDALTRPLRAKLALPKAEQRRIAGIA
ncbi:hypothetical protein [Streptomyces tubercidicus]|uniref:hypothetical protein n=1 Tax=Streptomyces tubercidicus TaxID=47759 RepID=UPI003690EBC3